MTQTAARNPLAVRDFRLLWIGEAVSAVAEEPTATPPEAAPGGLADGSPDGLADGSPEASPA